MGHIKNLLMNTIRDALDKMQSSGVGYIDLERKNAIFYCVDEKWYMITVSEVKGKDVTVD